MLQLDTELYNKMIASINEDEAAKQRGDYFLIHKSRELAREPGLLSRMGVHITQGIGSFAEGMASYPITWWAAHIHLLALSGVFGTKQRQRAKIRQYIFRTLLQATLKLTLRTGRTILTYHRDKILAEPVDNLSRLGGRFVGGYLTNRYLLSGIVSKKFKSLVGAPTNTVYSMYGAVILSIAKGVNSLEGAVWAAISGEYDFPQRKILERIKNCEATDEELEEAFNLSKPILKQIYSISNKKMPA